MGQWGSRIGLVISSLVCLSIAAGCGGRMPKALAEGSGRLAPCPSSPNCVSSDATDELHSIAAYRIRGDADTAWRGLASHLAELPRIEVVRNEGGYLQAVFTTRLMRYRDDVEFQLDEGAGVIRVRSASRIGHGDMGVNRERIESIRAALAERGLVEPRAASQVSIPHAAGGLQVFRSSTNVAPSPPSRRGAGAMART